MKLNERLNTDLEIAMDALKEAKAHKFARVVFEISDGAVVFFEVTKKVRL